MIRVGNACSGLRLHLALAIERPAAKLPTGFK